MSISPFLHSNHCVRFLLCSIFLSYLSGVRSTGVVTLQSFQVFSTHDWFTSNPTVYFQCKGENRTVLPDVTGTAVLYTFKGQESWQPLTELHDTKCKRCGFYEQDTMKTDHVFDEWEFCPSDFDADEKNVHIKENEITASFLCQGCSQLPAAQLPEASEADSGSTKRRKEMHVAIVILLIALAVVVVILVVVGTYKYLAKKKRRQDQLRFLKLFEEGDDIEDELDGNV